MMGEIRMSLFDVLHGELIHSRRVRVLAGHLDHLLPLGARVLDVGAGDGLLASLVGARRPDLAIEGTDVLVRDRTYIPIRPFDGRRVDAADHTYDVVLFVDVLHHAADPEALLQEGIRLTRRHLVIKDHTRDGPLAAARLRCMDWVGNARHGVSLPHNYWPRRQWDAILGRHALQVETWSDRLGLYPAWGAWLFESGLHFMARLRIDVAKSPAGAAGPAA